MKIAKNKFFMLGIMIIISVNLVFCGKKEEVTNNADKTEVVQKVEEKQSEKSETAETEAKESSEREVSFGKGIDEEFTTDGKLHEEKFLNKTFGYPDTADSFKIEKDSEGYFITDYIDESPILEKDVAYNPDAIYIVLEVEKEIVGFIGARTTEGTDLHITNVAVLHDYRFLNVATLAIFPFE